MYSILTLNKIAACGTDKFGSKYTVGDSVSNPDAIMVRSAAMHDMELPENLLAIARAGAGVNNIPVDKCSEQGIVVFNTPGANANAVKELVIAGLLLSSRKVVDGISWAKTLKGNGAEVGKMVEKGKSAFAGPEIKGKTLGVIGLGAIGVLVANAAVSLGMTVYGYDPFLSVKSAWGLNQHVHYAATLNDIYENCDYITLHVPQTPDTKGMINASSIAMMKTGVRILNFARGELVETADLLAALDEKKVMVYVTDFADDEMLGHKGVVALPHLGASTPESEDNCAKMAVEQVMNYLETGNIVNSVNLPAVSQPRSTACRICVIHKNVSGVLNKISSVLAEDGINIENMVNASKKDYAYSIFDVAQTVGDEVSDKISAIPDVIRVRII